MLTMLTSLLILTTSLGAETADYLERTTRVDEWIIGPQPDAEDLDRLRDHGISLIINTRRPQEMEALGFDQQSEAEQRGMRYELIPVGGDEYPFSPERLDAFTAVLESADGPVALHCRSGYRASVLLAGYLVRSRGVPIEEAVERMDNDRVTVETVRSLLGSDSEH